MVITVDLETDDFDALNTAASQILGELERRRLLEEAEQQIDQINGDVQRALGREPGDPWVQPLGAHDAYPADWWVTHDGDEWDSLLAGNVWEPGVSGWRKRSGDDGGDEWPEWVRPTGAHDAYNMGDGVTWEGSRYRSTIDGNTWSPGEWPDGWELVTDGGGTE